MQADRGRRGRTVHRDRGRSPRTFLSETHSKSPGHWAHADWGVRTAGTADPPADSSRGPESKGWLRAMQMATLPRAPSQREVAAAKRKGGERKRAAAVRGGEALR